MPLPQIVRGLNRRTVPWLACLAAMLSLAWGLAADAAAAPKGARVLGTAVSGTSGGLFNAPRDVAVNDGTGDVYVVDKSNHRIQRFGADGSFERAWGWDVSQAANDGFEICTSAADCKAGLPGSASDVEGGRLSSPSGIAVDQVDGSVYVWNVGKQRVDKFTADGAFLLTLGAPGSDAGQLGQSFREPSLAVDPTSQDLVVADAANARVAQYEADGDFVRVWGWDVANPAGGTDFEVCTTNCKAGIETPAGFSDGRPVYVAVGPDQIVYASDSDARHRVHRFDLTASQASDLLLLPAISDAALFTRGLEVDQGDDRLHAAIDPSGVLEFDATTLARLAAHAVEGMPNVEGFGRNDASQEEYLSTGNIVVALNEAGAPLADVPDAPDAHDPGGHTIDADVTVTPNGPAGIPATGRFEVSKDDGVTWLPAGSPVALGTGTDPVAVSQTIPGLEANRGYDIRFVVTKPYGNPAVVSPASQFTTLSPAPEVETGAAQFVSAKTAQVLARVNPNNLPTTYRVEYGTTIAYGASEPESDDPPFDAGGEGLERTLLVRLTELAPTTEYHYRVVATNSQGTTVGSDRTFTTRALPEPEFLERGLEMVTPPDKNNRRTNPILKVEIPNPGVPSPDGNAMLYGIQFGILDGESGVAFPHTFDIARIARGATGWKAADLHNVASPISGIGSLMNMVGSSADFAAQAWQHKAYMFEDSRSTLSTRLFGDTGGPLGKGWYDWLVDPAIVAGIPNVASDAALIDDAGARMLRWSGEAGYKGLLGAADPSGAQVDGADAVYLQEPVGTGGRELVNECSGTATLEQQTLTVSATGGSFTVAFAGSNPSASITPAASAAVMKSRLEGLSTLDPGDVDVVRPVGSDVWTVTFTGRFAGVDVPEIVVNPANLTGGTVVVATVVDGAPGPNATLIPERRDNGTPGDASDDVVGDRPCVEGRVTSVRGAVGGGGNIGNPGGGTQRTAMSRDGARVFFTSPDPGEETTLASCTTGLGATTACPPQIFVRQYAADGEASVRWISRSQVAGQQIGLVGRTGFEGASGDGKVVFFKTNAPLTEDDPNGGAQVPGGVTTGSASDSSWDLYRYELPGDREQDPAGGTLTRVSGGPGGDADPNVLNVNVGGAGALRYLSEDGQRAYFVTRGIIGDTGDSWNQPPAGGATAPSGVPGSVTRNLYLYDASKTGDARWRFIAQLPTSGHEANRCASLSSRSGMTQDFILFNVAGGQEVRLVRLDNNCVRGVPDGRAIAFETGAQLTDDDTDSASDVYFYDADADELVRVSSPPDDDSAYLCAGNAERCNGDFGFQPQLASSNDQIGLNGAQRMNIARNDNGTVSVFFETRVPLVPEDTNGTRMDVYEWQAGAIALVSPGDSPDHDSYFSGNSLAGDDVFFVTPQRLDPREIDKDYDVYDARVGGGFPYTPPPASCDPTQDACRGSGAPGLDGQRTTVDPPGDGNVDPPDRVTLRLRGLSRNARRRAARLGTLALTVTSTKPARVVGTARTRVGGKSRKAGRGVKRFARAGAGVLRIRLNAVTRKRLRKGKALVLEVKVSTPGALTRTVTVRLGRSGR